MAQQIIKGNEIQVFLNGNTALAWATAHTLTVTGNTNETSSKDHGNWGASDVNSITWEVTGEYFYTDADYDTLFDLMLYRRPVLLKIAKVKNYDENGLTSAGGHVSQWFPAVKGRSGYAVITNLAVNANTGENATYSITFTGNGPLTEFDNTTTNYYIDVTYDDNDLVEGMQLFNTSASDYVNSGWVYSNSGEGRQNLTQIDITDAKLHDDPLPAENTTFRYYLVGNYVPEHMFHSINTIDTVTLNVNVTEISEYAFASSSVTTLTTNVTNMNYKHHCFNDCLELNNINKSHDINYLSARYIANDAFTQCVQLGTISTGDSCEYVLASAFSECVQMGVIYFGDSMKRLGDYAFSTSSHSSNKEFHFYTEDAPNLGELPLGQVGYQTVYLHNSNSVREFLQSNDSWRQYETADIQIAS